VAGAGETCTCNGLLLVVAGLVPGTILVLMIGGGATVAAAAAGCC